MKKRGFRFLLAAFVVAVFLWLFYTPRHSGSLLSAIPPEAKLVTTHQDIAGRYNALLENPFAASLLNSAGLPLDELREQLRQPAHAKIIDFLLSGECSFSYVPPTIYNRSDMWVFTDWLGGRATLLQVVLNWCAVPYVKLCETHNAVPVYRFDSGDRKLPLFLAVVEGGIIGCICPDPNGIRRVIDGYLSHDPVTFQRYTSLFSGTALLSDADKGWYRLAMSTNFVTFGVSRLCSNRVDATIEFSQTEIESNTLSNHTVMPVAHRLFGSLPSLVIETSAHDAADVLRKMISPRGLPAIKTARDLLPDVPLTMALFGDDEYSGRFSRMRFPSLVLVFDLPDTLDAEEQINTYIDRLNAVYRVGLVPETISVSGGRSVYVIEGTASGDYAKRPFNERIAYTVISNQLVISSAPEALIKLTARYDRTESGVDMSEAVWPTVIEQQAPAHAVLWLDFVKGGSSIRLAIAAYAISLMRGSAEDAETARMLVADADAWTTALEPMQQLIATYRTENGKGTVEIHTGL